MQILELCFGQAMWGGPHAIPCNNSAVQSRSYLFHKHFLTVWQYRDTAALLEGRFAVRIWGVKLPIQKFHFQESSVRETAEIQNSFMHKYLNFLICIQKKENIGSVNVHWWPVVM